MKRLTATRIAIVSATVFFTLAAVLLTVFKPLVPFMGYTFEFRDLHFWFFFLFLVLSVSMFTIFYEKLYKPYFVLPALGVFSFALFFSYPLVLTWDSAHYLAFLPIISGEASMETWDVVRGPTFPVLLWLIVSVFGTTAGAMLLVHYLFYALTLYFYYLIVKLLIPLSSTNQKLTAAVVIYAIVGLNILVFGYYHVMLTEYLASFFTAVIIYCAIAYYKQLENDSVNRKYRLYQLLLIISAPVIFFLKQNYLMLTMSALLAIIVLTFVRRLGKKRVLRAIILFCCTIVVFTVSFIIWNASLPEIEDEYEAEWMRKRTSERVLVHLFIADTDYIQHSNMRSYFEKHPDRLNRVSSILNLENDTILSGNASDMIITFYDSNNNLIDAYIVNDVVNRFEISIPQAAGIFFRNLFKHPTLLVRGIADAYLASSNFFEVQSPDGVALKMTRNVSPVRAYENQTIGYYTFYQTMTHSYVSSLPEGLFGYAEPFLQEKNTGSSITAAFLLSRFPVNFTFTLGLLLLPFIWIGSIVFIFVKKKETAFIISFISASVSFGYALLNSVFQAFLDRYSFPVYISTWIAIVALGCGVYRVVFMRNKCRE